MEYKQSLVSGEIAASFFYEKLKKTRKVSNKGHIFMKGKNI